MKTTQIQETIQFSDGSRVVITAEEGEEAKTAFFAHFKPVIDLVQEEIAHHSRVCCADLQNALGDKDRYPALVFLSAVDWANGHPAGHYHGADGAGFYERFRLEGRDQQTYVRLETCPFCDASLGEPVVEEGELYQDDLPPG